MTKKHISLIDNIIISSILFLAIFTPLTYGAVQPWSTAVVEVVAAIMIILFLSKMVFSSGFEFVRIPGLLFFMFFMAYVSFQLITSNPQIATKYYHATRTDILKILAYFFVFTAALNSIKTRKHVMLVLSVIIGTGFIMSVFSLLRHLGADVPRGLVNPDHFAGYLGMIIPASLGVLLAGRSSKKEKSYIEKRMLIFFAIGVMGAGLLFTMSRGGMFSFFAALMVMAVLIMIRKSVQSKGWIIGTVVLFLIAIIIWIGATPLLERIMSIKVEITSRYFGGRWPIWTGTVQMIKDHLQFGTGLGSFQYVFPKYQPVEINHLHYSNAHCDIMELLVETGLTGFILASCAAVLFFGRIIKKFFTHTNSFILGLSIGLIGSIMSIFVHSLADFNLHIPGNAVLLSIILALLLSVLNTKDSIRFNMGKVRFILYLVIPVLGILFIVAAVKPALAHHYFQMAGIENRKFELLKKSAAIDPKNALYHYELGKLFYSQGKLQNALKKYKESIELNPNSSKYRQSLAWTYGVLNENEKAVEEFNEAIACYPNNPYRHWTYAIWLLDNENRKEAVDEFKKAIVCKPQLLKDAFSLYGKDQKGFEKLIELLPGTEKADVKAFFMVEKEKGLEFAVNFAKKFLKTYNINSDLHFWIADKSFYDKAFPWEYTEEHYKKTFELGSERGFHRLWYGIHLNYRGNYSKALENLEMSLKLDLMPDYVIRAKEEIAKSINGIEKSLEK